MGLENWQAWLDKKVYIKLKDGRQYSGIVIDVTDSSEYFSTNLLFITIIDKFEKRVQINVDEIKIIQEENGG